MDSSLLCVDAWDAPTVQFSVVSGESVCIVCVELLLSQHFWKDVPIARKYAVDVMKGTLMDNQGYEQFLFESQGLLPDTMRHTGWKMNLGKALVVDHASAKFYNNPKKD